MSEVNLEPDPEYERKAAHVRLVNEVVVSLGFLGPTRSPKKVVQFIQPGSLGLFRDEAFSKPSYSARGYEMIDAWLENLQVLPFCPAIVTDNGEYHLSELGQHHYDTIMKEFGEEPVSHPYVTEILSAVAAASLPAKPS